MVQLSRSFLSALVLSTTINATWTSHCKCTPGDICWPSQAEWSALNSSALSGALLKGIQPASVCYTSEPNYNEAECEVIRSRWYDSTFHADDPISIDYPVRINNPCNPIWPNGTSLTGDPHAGEKGCSLGQLPPYVFNATTAEHVSQAIKWAAEKNIRVIVKNTGHSVSARSSGYGSLSIWTHHLRGIEYIDSFQPSSCPTNGTFKAARFAAGETGISVNTELAKNKAIVVTGANPDVGIMGWLPGGGHGFLSSEYGMGADNLLEATVVTADGSILLANPCQNADLFYAIRGGGGAFGVILEAVVKAFDTPQTTLHQFAVQASSSNLTNEFYEFIGYLTAQLPRLKQGGMQGYYYIFGPPVQPTLTLVWTFLLYNKPEGTVESLMAPIEAWLNEKSTLFRYVSNSTTAPTYMDIYSSATNEAVANGAFAYGSWLLTPESLSSNPEATARIMQEIGPRDAELNGIAMGTALIGHMIAHNDPSPYYPETMSMNPAWRKTLLHFFAVEGWADGANESFIDEVYRDITENKIAPLRKLSPDTGAYFNEADYNQPDWQWAFFGENYERLREIKKKYDPKNLFWCRQCVGSEALVQREDGRLCSADEGVH